MTVYPNAKLNIGLNVLRKRDDGYHEIISLLVPYFVLRDKLEITLSPIGRNTIEIRGGSWNPLSDLSFKACDLLQKDFDLPPVSIILEKHIPVGAGLGGGSADASFTLMALNEMFSIGLSEEKLAQYAAQLGSDCPFFIYNRPMLAEGRGEILSEYQIDLSVFDIKVEMPEGIKVRTSEAYSGIVPSQSGICNTEPLSLQEALKLPVEEWKKKVENDFEKSVFALYPQIAELKQHFYDTGAVYASMSGSGAAVFGLWHK